jgi:hypothetical protein
LGVDVHEARSFQTTFNGMMKNVRLYRANNLVVIFIPALQTTPLTTGEFVSSDPVPDTFLPRNGMITPTMTFITINSNGGVGSAYIGADNKIHISASGYPGVPFQEGVPDCGPSIGTTMSFII